MAASVQMDLNIEIDVFTARSASEIVNAVLEFLLYQRNQIPFVFKTYKYYVHKWQENKNKKEEESKLAALASFNLERQRERAAQTNQSISAMTQLIQEAFEENDIKCLRFLFGATAHTPHEAYTIHIPTAAISRKHSYIHHPLLQTHLNQMLINLISNQDLYGIFSKNLCPTNVFLELEIFERNVDKDEHKARIFPKEFCDLPISCKDIQLNLMLSKPITKTESKSESVTLQCCKDLCIYSDFLSLSITDTDEGVGNEKNDVKLFLSKPSWWESEIFVRGFKENPTKSGGGIWMT